jgi:hypothetical protein
VFVILILQLATLEIQEQCTLLPAGNLLPHSKKSLQTLMLLKTLLCQVQ